MAFSEKRVERMASATVMPTKKELESAISDAKNGTMFNYRREVPVFVRSVAERAEAVGKMACGSEGCDLECVGLDLTGVQTPKSNTDAALVARCKDTNCSDIGVEVAAIYFQDSLRLAGE